VLLPSLVGAWGIGNVINPSIDIREERGSIINVEK